MVGTVDANAQIQQQDISHHWEQLWPDMRAVGCWSTIRADDAIFALVLLTPYSPAHEEWIDGRPTRAMNLREFLAPGAVCNCPSLERPVGANVIPADRNRACFTSTAATSIRAVATITIVIRVLPRFSLLAASVPTTSGSRKSPDPA